MKSYFFKIFILGFVVVTSKFLYAQEQPEIPSVYTHQLIASGVGGFPSLNAGDQMGWSVSRIGDLNNDGTEDFVVGAPYDDDGGASTVDKGAVYIVYMKTDRTVKKYRKISASETLLSGKIDNLDNFGFSVAGIGDLNADGIEDIAVGAIGDDAGFTNAGAVWILFLDTSGVVTDTTKLCHNTNGFGASKSGAFLGSACAQIGDIDDDGIEDIVVGAYQYTTTGSIKPGAAYVLRMNTNGTVDASTLITSSSGGFTGTLSSLDFFGYGCEGAGDLNEDGVEDIIVSAPQDDDYYTNAGALWILYLNTNGTVTSSKKLTQPFTSENIYFGGSAPLFGKDFAVYDIDNDGQSDILAGAYGMLSVYALRLDANENITHVRAFGSRRAWNHTLTTEQFGASVSIISDIGNDRKPEILVGAASHSEGGIATQGGIYILSLNDWLNDNPEGLASNHSQISSVAGNFTDTINTSDNFGHSICKLGDLNNDGIDDMVVGVPYDNDGGVDKGCAYVLILDANSNVSTSYNLSSNQGGFGTGLDGSDLMGSAVASIGDMDADNVEDFVVGASHDDDGGANAGAVYIVYMNSTGTVKSKLKISNGTGGFTGTIPGSSRFGSSIAFIGDLDNDGVEDMAVGAPYEGKGSVWILFMNSNGTVKGQNKITTAFGDTWGTTPYFGWSLCRAGDLNGDGNEDLWAGSIANNNTGAVYALYLNTSGNVTGYKKINNAGSNFPHTLKSGERFGASIATIGDINNDGVTDVAIGSSIHTSYTLQKGGVWIVRLDTAENVLDADLLNDSTGRFYMSMNDNDLFAASLAYMGDDSNGNPKLCVGSPDADHGGTDRGLVVTIQLVNSKNTVTYSSNQYATLKTKPDGGYYHFQDGILRFQYEEEYHDTDSKLKFNVYDKRRKLVYSDVNLTLAPALGVNRYEIDFSCTNPNVFLPTGYYILETINQKNERKYLRFYVKTNIFNCLTLCCPSGWGK